MAGFFFRFDLNLPTRIVAALGLAGSVACAPGASSEGLEALAAVAERPLRGGDALSSLAGLTEEQGRGLGVLKDDTGRVRCTAALIAPDFVLSAAHCLVLMEDTDLARAQAVAALSFVSAAGAFPLSTVVVHEALDIAVFGLGAAIPNALPLALSLSNLDGSLVDEEVVVIGGGNGTPDNHLVSVGRFLVLEVTTDAVRMTPLDDDGLCPGDSGAPVLRSSVDGLRVIAVHRSGFDDCSGPASATPLDDARDWLPDNTRARPPAMEPCGDDMPRCDEALARTCTEGFWRTVDCGLDGSSCVVNDDGSTVCVPPPCGAVSPAGLCEGGVARFCAGGRLHEENCAALDKGCALDPTLGRRACVECPACAGVCVDHRTDPVHCGGCDHACEAGPCEEGRCVGGDLSDAGSEPPAAADNDDPPPPAVSCGGAASPTGALAWLSLPLIRRRRRPGRRRCRQGRRRERGLPIVLVLFAAILAISCAPTEEPLPGSGDANAALFAPRRVLRVDVTMASGDWNILRKQHHDMSRVAGRLCSGELPIDPYEEFPAHVQVDDVVIENVQVRKKGFFGSNDEESPSLKIDVDDGRAKNPWGVSSLTLNNSKSDASYLKQCLGYAMFAAAGLPAPRCNFARVFVNGDDKGLYVHVEGIQASFLQRAFGGHAGALYEGRVADFRPDLVELFDKKGVANDADTRALYALTAALQLPDDDLLPALAQWVDLDAFFRFWAMEVLVGAVDGYANSQNNFFVHRRSDDGRLVFVPWGLDTAFQSTRVEHALVFPFESVTARGELARRLFLHPQGHARYYATLDALLDEVFDEQRWRREVDALEDLLAPLFAGTAQERLRAAVADVRVFLGERRALIRTERASPVIWTESPLPGCVLLGALSATAVTTWGTHDEDPFAAGTAVVHIDPPRGPALDESGGARAGARPWGARVEVVWVNDGGQRQTVQLDIDRGAVEAIDPALRHLPLHLPLDQKQAAGALFQERSGRSVLTGVVTDGELVLGAPTIDLGEAAEVRVSGQLWCVPRLAGSCDGPAASSD